MNVSLHGARSQARLDWDSLEERSRRAQILPRIIFAVALIGFVSYLAWGYFAG